MENNPAAANPQANMVEVKTIELIGPALDWAVAKAIGEEYRPATEFDGIGTEYPAHQFSTKWDQGGPLIERGEIELHVLANVLDIAAHPTFKPGDEWEANIWPPEEDLIEICGPTPLIAAMRCFVSMKLGATVQVPKELMP